MAKTLEIRLAIIIFRMNKFITYNASKNSRTVTQVIDHVDVASKKIAKSKIDLKFTSAEL